MRTRILHIIFWLLSPTCFAENAHEHDPALYHAFTLQADGGEGRDDTISRWDLDGWLGGDEHKLWLKSEGNETDNKTEHSEVWALYSYNIDTFWDAQLGVRYDNRPESISYLVFGFNGLAPYFLETEAHLFVDEEGYLTARWREEKDFLITQKLILQPYAEMTLDPGQSEGELGLQLRYEIIRTFAPYAEITHTHSDDGEDLIIAAGVQMIF